MLTTEAVVPINADVAAVLSTRMEASDRMPVLKRWSAGTIKGVLIAAGVEFLKHGEPGVGLRKAKP